MHAEYTNNGGHFRYIIQSAGRQTEDSPEHQVDSPMEPNAEHSTDPDAGYSTENQIEHWPEYQLDSLIEFNVEHSIESDDGHSAEHDADGFLPDLDMEGLDHFDFTTYLGPGITDIATTASILASNQYQDPSLTEAGGLFQDPKDLKGALLVNGNIPIYQFIAVQDHMPSSWMSHLIDIIEDAELANLRPEALAILAAKATGEDKQRIENKIVCYCISKETHVTTPLRHKIFSMMINRDTIEEIARAVGLSYDLCEPGFDGMRDLIDFLVEELPRMIPTAGKRILDAFDIGCARYRRDFREVSETPPETYTLPVARLMLDMAAENACDHDSCNHEVEHGYLIKPERFVAALLHWNAEHFIARIEREITDDNKLARGVGAIKYNREKVLKKLSQELSILFDKSFLFDERSGFDTLELEDMGRVGSLVAVLLGAGYHDFECSTVENKEMLWSCFCLYGGLLAAMVEERCHWKPVGFFERPAAAWLEAISHFTKEAAQKMDDLFVDDMRYYIRDTIAGEQSKDLDLVRTFHNVRDELDKKWAGTAWGKCSKLVRVFFESEFAESIELYDYLHPVNSDGVRRWWDEVDMENEIDN